MEDKHQLSYEFITTAAPVQALGTFDGKAFYFRARHDSWSFGLAEDPQIEPEDIYSSDQGFYLEQKYGHGPHTASYMSLHNAELIINTCLLRYVSGAKDEPIMVESEDHIFSVYLEQIGPNRLPVMAFIRQQLSISPAQAKTLLARSRPLILQADRRDIEPFIARLTALEAQVTIE